MRGLPPAPERTPERPGPGPVPPAVLRSLDLAVLRRVESLVPGDHLTPQVGAGTELATIRPYRPGDDVRHIDWNVTARMQEPHVRVHVGERALTAWIVLDASSSMTFGTADRRKADVAEGVALTIGHVASRRGNRLGVVAFGGGAPKVVRPRQGRLGLLGLLAELRAEPEADGAGSTSLGGAVTAVSAVARARGLIVVVSDFRGDRDWEGPLRTLRARHGVLAVEVRDPRELELTPMGDLWLVDPETGRQLQVNTSRRRVRNRFAAAAAAEREEVAATLRRAGVDHLVLSTAGDWLRELAGYLRRGEASLRGRQGGARDVPRPDHARRPDPAAARGAGLPLDLRAAEARGAHVREPGADPQPRHRAAGLAAPPAAAAAAARARGARRRARAAAAHRRVAAARRDGDDGDRHLGLDERDRRRARPPDRGDPRRLSG